MRKIADFNQEEQYLGRNSNLDLIKYESEAGVHKFPQNLTTTPKF
jgi:hypothetical protein